MSEVTEKIKTMDKVLKVSSLLASISFCVFMFGLILTFGVSGAMSLIVGIPTLMIGLTGTVAGIISLVGYYIDWFESNT